MKIRNILIYFSVILCYASHAQLRVVKPVTTYPSRTNLAFGAGLTRSVLYLNRNVKENNDATGYQASLMYGGSRLVRVSIEYSFYKTIDIAPTWYKVNASTLEGNIHFLAKLKNIKAVFFPIVGISYNRFSGFFTGKNDNLNLRSIYAINKNVVTEWMGLNVGTGYEQYFKPGSFYIDYKMRVGIAEGTTQLNIMDVCFSAGLRINLRVPSIYRIVRGTRVRYFIKDDSDW